MNLNAARQFTAALRERQVREKGGVGDDSVK
jgi:hypothetical protein